MPKLSFPLDALVRSRPRPPADSPLERMTGLSPNPGALDGWALVPPGARALAVVLHGCRQDARGFARGTGWEALARQQGFALLLPDQNGPNNPWRCFNWFDPARAAAEAASILAMVRQLQAAHGLRQVFVAGLSAGGAMAARLLATAPGVFAGGAVVAGLPFGAASDAEQALAAMRDGAPEPAGGWAAPVRAAAAHEGPWPRVQVWQGLADGVVNPANAQALLAQWLGLHGITWAPRGAVRVDGAHRLTWHDEAGRPAVESWTLEGLDHGVPIGAGGVPGPFLLDCGCHSTWHIAAGWGLAGASRAAPEPLRHSPGWDCLHPAAGS
ncbi:alpha/beta hydrolase family esterase [Roseococcus sp. DSY-14]|uniref:extracellular catalytic domain type 1 short-chain-length polyhydroxyalkanoate depolymerase n=1 Tax=Roseococcus sp. DSY-14 TaxID=3369650 RepID=UPI00387AC50A